ncbi:MAG: hypothetical protein KGO81_12205, partial [Bacteroidota bacterium]|nr:hypothetical protein [Bacteroidota bacterium]
PAVLESQGFKRYSANIPTSNSTQAGELAGVVDIATTDVHKIKFVCIKDAGKGAGPTGAVTMDFIQFIPVDQDQQRPLFARDGTIVP